MRGAITEYFESDHRRLDRLLVRATADPNAIDGDAYAKFRSGLLRHIGLEEKIVFPMVQRLRGGAPMPEVQQLRLDHGALTALFVPPPTTGIIAAIRAILEKHNAMEEAAFGVYETSDELAGADTADVVEKAMHAPEVPVLPYNEDPRVLDATRRALARAGYNLDEYLKSDSRKP